MVTAMKVDTRQHRDEGRREVWGRVEVRSEAGAGVTLGFGKMSLGKVGRGCLGFALFPTTAWNLELPQH